MKRGDRLDDLLAPALRLVVCGSAASRRSAEVGHYYAGPGNRFWSVIEEVGLVPLRLEPREFRRLLEYGIGLTDVAKDQSGMDKELAFREHHVERLVDRVEAFAPGVLCFNGKRAASEVMGRSVAYGLQSETIGPTRLFVAPSTSAAARRWWSSGPWRRLAELVATNR